MAIYCASGVPTVRGLRLRLLRHERLQLIIGEDEHGRGVGALGCIHGWLCALFFLDLIFMPAPGSPKLKSASYVCLEIFLPHNILWILEMF